MKPTFTNIRVLGTTALALIFATSCSDILAQIFWTNSHVVFMNQPSFKLKEV